MEPLPLFRISFLLSTVYVCLILYEQRGIRSESRPSYPDQDAVFTVRSLDMSWILAVENHRATPVFVSTVVKTIMVSAQILHAVFIVGVLTHLPPIHVMYISLKKKYSQSELPNACHIERLEIKHNLKLFDLGYPMQL